MLMTLNKTKVYIMRILFYLYETGGVHTASDIAMHTDVPGFYMEKCLRYMKEHCLIQSTGRGRGRGYMLLDMPDTCLELMQQVCAKRAGELFDQNNSYDMMIKEIVDDVAYETGNVLSQKSVSSYVRTGASHA